MKNELTAVSGSFIGGASIAGFRSQGCTNLRAIDVKPLDEWRQRFDNVGNQALDLNVKPTCGLAAHMGGMGFIEYNKALCMLQAPINTHMLQAAQEQGVQKLFYSSSACVYNGEKHCDPNNRGLKKEGAYPALAEDGYGWEKLFSERMRRHFSEVYGPNRAWDDGREKAPADVCRKAIEAKLSGKREISIWGPGNRTRSFMYINLGSPEMATINQLVDIVEDIAGVERSYDLSAPTGGAGRNSGNTFIQKYLNWEPSLPLRTGMERTYAWIYDQYMAREQSLAVAGVH
jgi:GDP-D-mannose 3', 5'-epimerase